MHHTQALLLPSLLLVSFGCVDAGRPDRGGSLGGKADDPAICGDGTVGGEEECDDGNVDVGDGCDASCRIEATAFRISNLKLRDPHAFVRIFFGCSDVTDRFNDSIEEQLTEDGDEDGYLDLGLVGLFRPLAPAAESTPVEVLVADCTAPVDTTTCARTPDQESLSATAFNHSEGICLEPIDGTTSGYEPAPNSPGSPCFASDSHELELPVGETKIKLTDARVAATYAEGRLTTGQIRGFLSEADADAMLLPDDLPIVGGKPISFILPGGEDNCSDEDDRDLDANGVRGWYLYFNFGAKLVAFEAE